MERRNRTTRRVLAATLGIIAAATVAVVGAPPLPPASAATATEPEARDYATDTYGDAWDFSTAADANTAFSPSGASVSGGALNVTLADGASVMLVHSISGSVPYGRDGALQPVDTSRYTHLSFSMDQPLANRIGAVYWFTCREQSAACGGGMTFPTVQGKHTYDLDLAASSVLLGKRAWRSAKMVVVRLDPVVFAANSPKAGTAKIDWVRLASAADATHPHAALPPGSYGSYTITPRPQVVVDSPNPSQGPDLAAVQRGASWDFRSASATSGVRYEDATVLSRDDRGITARNAAPSLNDPRVLLPVSPFVGNSYHYLQFDMSYDGRFNLADVPGGGKMARVIWNVKGSGNPQIGNDILTYDSGNQSEVTLDLTARDPLDESAIAPRLGWGGRTVTSLRFDPNEDPSAATWHLRSLHLRADPTANGSTTVQFHDGAWVAGTTAMVAVSAGPHLPASSTFVEIAKNVAVAKGTNGVKFTLGSMRPDRYWVKVSLRHPDGSVATSYSSAPVVLRR